MKTLHHPTESVHSWVFSQLCILVKWSSPKLQNYSDVIPKIERPNVNVSFMWCGCHSSHNAKVWVWLYNIKVFYGHFSLNLLPPFVPEQWLTAIINIACSFNNLCTTQLAIHLELFNWYAPHHEVNIYIWWLNIQSCLIEVLVSPFSEFATGPDG